MIDLKSAIGSNSGKPIGSLAWFKNPTTISGLLVSGGSTYLRSGYVSKAQQALYPDAYAAYVTPPGEKWSKVNSVPYTANIGGPIRRIAFGNGIFVGVGINGFLVTSTDGITWIQQPVAALGSAYNWLSVAWSDAVGLFVAVGTQGQIKTSPDGVNWTARINPLTSSYVFYDVCYGNGKFVIATTTGSTTNRAIYSTDGITWVSASTTNFSSIYSANQITYGNGLFIIIGTSTNSAYLTSSDGLAWNLVSTNITTTTNVPPSRKIIYGGNGFYYAQNTPSNSILFSANGTSGWTTLTNQPQTLYQHNLFYANGVLFSWCFNTVSLTNDVYISKNNGTSWTLVSSTSSVSGTPSFATWSDIAYGLNEYVSIDNGNQSSAATAPVAFVSFDNAIGLPLIQTLSSEVTRYMRIK